MSFYFSKQEGNEKQHDICISKFLSLNTSTVYVLSAKMLITIKSKE
jgi:hypothetical protein